MLRYVNIILIHFHWIEILFCFFYALFNYLIMADILYTFKYKLLLVLVIKLISKKS